MARLSVAGPPVPSTLEFVFPGLDNQGHLTGVAVEQCQGAPLRPGRSFGRRGAVVGDGRRLESLLEKSAAGGTTSRSASTRANRSAAGQFGVSGSSGKTCGSRSETAETRPQAKTTQAPNQKEQELGTVSPEPCAVSPEPCGTLTRNPEHGTCERRTREPGTREPGTRNRLSQEGPQSAVK